MAWLSGLSTSTEEMKNANNTTHQMSVPATARFVIYWADLKKGILP
jgi:hypothetical protein